MQTAGRGALLPGGAAGAAWVLGLTVGGETEWQTRIEDLVTLGAASVGDDEVMVLGSDLDRTALSRVVVAPDRASFERTTFGAGGAPLLPLAVTVAGDGSTFAAGIVELAGEPFATPWSVRLDGDGSIGSETRWVTPFGVTVTPAAVGQRADSGTHAIAGRWGEFDDDAWVALLDADGALVSSRRFGDARWEGASAIAATPGGGWIVVGSIWDPETLGTDAWVFAVDAAGGIVWRRSIGAAGVERATSVVARPGGGVAFVGTAEEERSTLLWLVALDEGGDVEWQLGYAAAGSGRPGGTPQITRTDDGGFLVTAQRFSGPAESDAWVLQLDPDGELAPGGCAGRTETVATSAETIAVPVEAPIFADDALRLEPTEDAGNGTAIGPYVRVECGEGESTAWGTTGVAGACDCPAGSTCVGPETGCDLGLTCVGHYSQGGNPIAECAHGCVTNESCPVGATCHYLQVGETFLGAWCY